MKNRFISLVLIFILSLGSLYSCFGAGGNDGSSEGSNKGGNKGGNEGGNEGGDEGGNNVTLETPTATVLPVKGGANGIVVLIHDDGYIGTVEIFDGLLKKHGLVGDIALVTSFVYNTTTKTAKAAEVQKFQKFLDTGRWKIVSHSYTHEWWGVNGIENAERMYEEIVGSQAILRELFPGERVLTFAYPGLTSAVKQYGSFIVFSSTAQALIEETYISGRKDTSTEPHGVTDTELNWKCLTGFGFLNGSVKNGTIEAIVNDAANNEGLALLYTHQIKSGTETKQAADAASYGNIQMGSYYMDESCRVVAEQVADGKIWNTHYEDAILYIREAQTASATVTVNEDGTYSVTLTDKMDDEIYNFPLTVRTLAADGWEAVRIAQGESVSYALVKEIDGVAYVDADIVPDGGEATLTPISLDEYGIAVK